MPRYKYVQIGFSDKTLAEIDERTDNRSAFVREVVEKELEG